MEARCGADIARLIRSFTHEPLFYAVYDKWECGYVRWSERALQRYAFPVSVRVCACVCVCVCE